MLELRLLVGLLQAARLPRERLRVVQGIRVL